MSYFKKRFSIFITFIFIFLANCNIASAYGYFVKIISIGNFSCGKTSVLNSYLNAYNKCHTKDIYLREKNIDHNGNTFTLKLWDTAGEERYHDVVRAFFRSTHIAFVVVDSYVLAQQNFALDDLKSTLERWCNEIWAESPNCRVILLGNKKDLLNYFDQGRAERALQTAAGDVKKYSNHYIDYAMISAEDVSETQAVLDKHIKLALDDIGVYSLSTTYTSPSVRIGSKDIYETVETTCEKNAYSLEQIIF